MRIGELVQLRWEDVDFEINVIHVQRGGSDGRPKDKEDRFIPIHSTKLRPVLQSLAGESEVVFIVKRKPVSEKKLLIYLKDVCEQCGFTNPRQYKLHTLRHFSASYCAQQNMSYKYVLEWMGHSSSAILDMYFTMDDRQAQVAMNGLSFRSDRAGNRTIVGQ